MTDFDDNGKGNLGINRRPSQYSNRRNSRMVNQKLDWSHVKSKLKEMGISVFIVLELCLIVSFCIVFVFTVSSSRKKI